MMINYLEKIHRNENPFVEWEVNELDGTIDPLYELKFGLIFYTNYPPGPNRSRLIFDLYMRHYSTRIKRFISTSPGEGLQDWTPKTMNLFHDQLLPTLRQKLHWGYGFDDGNPLDSYLFMFHGYRPVKEKGKASFFRFEFPWNVDQGEVKQLAIDIAKLIPFENGFGGYFFKPAVYIPESYNKMYAVCRRFWGIDSWNLDVSVKYVLDGYMSGNWLTLIGNSLGKRNPRSVQEAKETAESFFDSENGVILQASEQALLGDRNYGESMPGYFAIAKALLPLQMTVFGSFGGELWDEISSFNWIRRFTHPAEVG
jgi:hypothetical protein